MRTNARIEYANRWGLYDERYKNVDRLKKRLEGLFPGVTEINLVEDLPKLLTDNMKEEAKRGTSLTSVSFKVSPEMAKFIGKSEATTAEVVKLV